MLLDKYLYGRPTYRLGAQLKHHGLPLSQGTLTDGLRKKPALFEPVLTKLYEHQMHEKPSMEMKRGGRCLKRSTGERVIAGPCG